MLLTSPHHHATHTQVLSDCAAAMAIHQDQLLQEVSKILAKPARNSAPAARARQAAMELLRHYGAQGGNAYRAARMQVGWRRVWGEGGS
jgi:hypothetical protein